MASGAVLAILENDPISLLQPSAELYNTFIQSSKSIIDPVALNVSNTQQQRLQESRKRKRGSGAHPQISTQEVLRLKQLHTEGFGFEQVWAQAQKVIDATTKEVEILLAEALQNRHASEDEEDDDRIAENGTQEGLDEEADLSDDMEVEDDGDEMIENMEDFSDEDLMAGPEGIDDFEGDILEDEEVAEDFVQDPNGLNDGFFSIDAFNKQSEFLERQDAKGDPDDGAASDEEDVDWAADPLAEDLPVAKKSKTHSARHNDVEEEDFSDVDEDDAEGPTFGDMDLDAPEGASDEEAMIEDDDDDDLDDIADINNANNIMYTDFFAPPARKASKKRGRPHPHNFPQKNASTLDADNDDEEVQRAMRSVHNDLFPSEDEEEPEEDEVPLDPGDPRSRRSTHERRQAALGEEIRKLEAENVSKRKWTLAGEARAADRPLNALLEEDLEFERVGKPIAPITQEVNDDIEAMIKRRILAREFDEVIRRRPDSLTSSDARPGKLNFELSDQKSGKGLAEEYEDEHLRRTDPNFVEVQDARLKKEHKEIETLWKDVSAKLDALSSWHYKPRPVQAQMEVRVDAPVLSLEDARPTAGGEVASASALAPQEVYKPGEVKTNGEVVTKAGIPIAVDELSREQKKRRRMREKERTKKAGTNTTGTTAKNDKTHREQSHIIGDLKKGGVKVIGKKGELREVDGKAANKGRQSGNAGSLKL